MAQARDKADEVFSLYIRHRDCPDGTGRCISCSKSITVLSSDCGHYIPRQYMATRFDEKNCNAQCRDCNRKESGNLKGYTAGLIRKYGDGIIDELHRLKNTTKQYKQSDLRELIKNYTR